MNFINQLLENFKKEKFIHHIEIIFGFKFNKGIKYLLCAIDLRGKYARVIPIKDKKGTSIVNALQKS